MTASYLAKLYYNVIGLLNDAYDDRTSHLNWFFVKISITLIRKKHVLLSSIMCSIFARNVLP